MLLRGSKRGAQVSVRLFAIRQPGQGIVIGQPRDMRHHIVELAREDADFIFPLEVEASPEICAFADCNRVPSDSTEGIKDRTIQQSYQQSYDDHGGNHEVCERVVHGGIATPRDLSRYVDSQCQDGTAIKVSEGVVYVNEIAGLDQPTRVNRIRWRQH